MMRRVIALLALGGLAWAASDSAYEQAAPQTAAQLAAFNAGAALFDEIWVAPPAADDESLVGLGPTYNGISCLGCHIHNGKGRAPLDGGEAIHGLLLRLSVPGTDAHGGPLPEPDYGGQFKDHALPGVPAEGVIRVSYHYHEVALADGTEVQLRAPRYQLEDLRFGPLRPGTMISARVAQAVIGAGELEAIPAAAIEAEAARQQAAAGAVHGHANLVWDVALGRLALGRFGWKANQPSVLQQVAAAGSNDMGLTSPLYPVKNCPEVQTACRAMAAQDHGQSGFSLTLARLQQLVAYIRSLQVPAPRPGAGRGARLFTTLGCEACHRASWTLADGQTIHPYTDLLLHDMGPGLADGRPDYQAGPRDWRTAPLWGIGLAQIVSPASGFLHDGRARNLTEAVLWHGGEAETARDKFASLDGADRAALLDFLQHL